ncbi:MAG: M20 metallopeptidase family protein [Anaerolineae bacterium]
MMNTIVALREAAERHFPSLIELQRDLHAHPEYGFEETRTAALVADRMRSLGLEVRTGVASTGVVAKLKGRRSGGAVALRVDMDAFPIEEADGLPWRSRTPGLAHVCGHDAHTTIGVGVAHVLAPLAEELPGTVEFIFQPAEERPLVDDEGERPYWEGVHAVSAAELMIQEGVLDLPSLLAVYGLHLWPWLPVGKIGVEEGPAMGGVANFRARVHGRSAHGATPQEGVDAIITMAQALCAMQTIVARQTVPGEPLVITVGTIRGGDRRNVIADRVDITGTVRALSAALLNEIVPARLQAIFAGVTAAAGASYELEYYPLIVPVMNDRELAESARRAIAEALGEEAVVPVLDRAMTSEDFACFAQRVPGLYLKIGCSEPGTEMIPLHNRAFRFDPKAILMGTIAVSSAIMARLQDQRRAG